MEFEKSQAVERLPEQFFSKLKGQIEEVAKNTDQPIINLAVGTPDMLPPKLLTDELKKAVDEPINNKYSPYRGYTSLKEAIANYYKREYDVDVNPETEIAVFDGTKGGLAKISQAMLNPGDTVLLPDPSYPDYKSGIAFQGAQIEPLPLLAENNYLVDYENIDSDIADQAKLLFINYPNNPTGAIATPEFFEETIEFAEKHNLCVIHDAAYGKMVFDDEEPLSYLQTPRAKEFGIEFFSLSKLYNISGWRVGFAIGNESVIEALNILQDHTTVSIYGGIQEAVAKMLNSEQSFVDELTATYEKRRDLFIDGIKPSGIEYKVPKGGFFVWLKVPEGFTSKEFIQYLLEDAHVVLADGSGFGESGEEYVRAGLVQSPETLTKATKRITESLKKLKTR